MTIRIKHFFFLFLCIALSMPTIAQDINITPLPKQVKKLQGEYVLPHNLVIGVNKAGKEGRREAERFCNELKAATDLDVTLGKNKQAQIRLEKSKKISNPEGYTLHIDANGIDITAATEVGFFYAFRSLLKLMPEGVALGVRKTGMSYKLPCTDVADEPRFHYRGFMLDVSRHFFTTKDIKKLLNLMALYKMNYFHWHLTDDQGWRVEIKKYPKLTTVGATRHNSWNTDLRTGSYWTNQTYGPYFYTQDEIRDVVEYAAGLHITVIPEIEMPGHFAAAVTAYPEFSCDPAGKHGVWVDGGISTDVLNVADPKAVQFAKDILEELIPLFPAPVFHIGGDETPTTAWKANELCKQVYEKEQMSDFSQLQSRFTREIAGFLRSKGKRIAVWNEAITAKGAATDMIKETGATVFCWNPCQKGAEMAADLGLNCIITNWGGDGCYYINRRANQADFGAGRGGDNLRKMYDYWPVPATVSADKQTYYAGVQATFWCEHVSNMEHLEHLALPRLMGVAEAGWTPQEDKNFDGFVARMKKDVPMLREAGYRYHPQYIDYEGAEAK